VAQGSARECDARLMEYRAAGVDLPVLFPMPVGGDWGYEQAIAVIGAVAKNSAATAPPAADRTDGPDKLPTETGGRREAPR